MKIRLVRTMIVEYEPDPLFYPEGYTIEQMAELDATSDDLESIFTDLLKDDVKWEIIE